MKGLKMSRKFKKLGLCYLREKNMACIKHPHYDLYEDDGTGKNTGYSVACILPSDKESINLIRKWIKKHNEE